MLVQGIRYECDACGRGVVGTSKAPPAGWRSTALIDLCPRCAGDGRLQPPELMFPRIVRPRPVVFGRPVTKRTVSRPPSTPFRLPPPSEMDGIPEHHCLVDVPDEIGGEVEEDVARLVALMPPPGSLPHRPARAR